MITASSLDQPGSIRAAQYVRMSTEHQKYSTENQAAAIAQYAEKHGFSIVRTYEDRGKSGLSLNGRPSLRLLIAEVCKGATDFEAVLVYDVSRWGRFQDVDESAHYEFICRTAGVAIEYCAELFDNDGSMGAAIIKNMKRLMAAEFSRDLSAKVFAGQNRLVSLGFRQGGSAGFGLRRQVLDEHRVPKLILGAGERKSLLTDRVVLTPGPPDEVDGVVRIFKMFVEEKQSEATIANVLNSEGCLNDRRLQWSRNTVRTILTNEKYIGNNVRNRVSFKLQITHVTNPRSAWVRSDGVFAAIVGKEIFAAAQRILRERRPRYTDQALLDRLSSMLAERGRLSKDMIDKTKGMPCCETYRQRFGSLAKAWQLIGYKAARDFGFVDMNKAIRGGRSNLVSQVIADIQEAGGAVCPDSASDTLIFPGTLRAYVTICRCQFRPPAFFRWLVSFRKGPMRDITIVARLKPDSLVIRDYCVFPWRRMHLPERNIRLSPADGFAREQLWSAIDAFMHP
jgi:DNA invertase Pin-like site-specific DNA recombinase